MSHGYTAGVIISECTFTGQAIEQVLGELSVPSIVHTVGGWMPDSMSKFYWPCRVWMWCSLC
ncbi:hypothetical protein [Budvicia aquatica]|uniref:hypothetical protein n=1 Tax=Budvicia aquatica TaxID=82979 RepID=UPI00106C27B7|nr:hypothetical protein [Budvicia aquatica]